MLSSDVGPRRHDKKRIEVPQPISACKRGNTNSTRSKKTTEKSLLCSVRLRVWRSGTGLPPAGRGVVRSTHSREASARRRQSLPDFQAISVLLLFRQKKMKPFFVPFLKKKNQKDF
jgi:hypothetical protein